MRTLFLAILSLVLTNVALAAPFFGSSVLEKLSSTECFILPKLSNKNLSIAGPDKVALNYTYAEKQMLRYVVEDKNGEIVVKEVPSTKMIHVTETYQGTGNYTDPTKAPYVRYLNDPMQARINALSEFECKPEAEAPIPANVY